MSSFRLRRLVAAAALATCFGALVQASPASAAPNTAGEYHSLTPARILDTRTGNGVPGGAAGALAQQELVLQVTGRGGVPATGVQAVVMNVTAAAPTSGGFISVWPTGDARPVVSSLNFVPGQTVPNLVTVKVGVAGAVSVFNSAGSTHVLADVVGYYDDATAAGGGWYNPLTPSRLLDTRATAAVAANSAINLTVTGRGGVPATGVQAVVLNVTAVDPSGSGFVTVWPSGVTPRPNASNLNFTAGQTIANLVIVGVNNGAVSFYNETGSTQLVVDVVGWFDTAGAQGLVFTAVTPSRAVDTRGGIPVGEDQGPYAPPVAGLANRALIKAVVMNVTATDTTADSYFTVYPPLTLLPSGTPRPEASNLNWKAGQTVPNAVMSAVSPANVAGLDPGLVVVYNKFGQAHLIIDLVGYFTAAA
jgi:hypothetical protein